MATSYIGQIISTGFNFAPYGYVPCDGRILQISQNDALFALIGTTYGGDGQNTFGIPDLRGRTPVHQGTGSGTAFVIGQSGGSETVTLNSNQIPSHTHGVTTQSATGSATSPAGAYFAGSTDNRWAASANGATASLLTANTGGQPHENRQPSLCISYAICIAGIFPTRN